MSIKSNSIMHNFREAATSLAGQLQLADRTAMTLASELQLAHEIILSLRRNMTLTQKLHVGFDLQVRGVAPDSHLRQDERLAALAMAKQYGSGQ
jgi:predicted transcriptional regulator